MFDYSKKEVLITPDILQSWIWGYCDDCQYYLQVTEEKLMDSLHMEILLRRNFRNSSDEVSFCFFDYSCK